jgi:hypothetical protein
MSGVFPITTVQLPAAVVLRTMQPTRISTAHSLKRQARTRGAQRWAIRMSWSPMRRNLFAVFQAFLLSQRGQADTFTTVLPGHTTPQGNWAGTPLVNGASQTGRSIVMDGFTASQTGVAKAGDLLKFAGHTKVYMVTADANSNGSGQATLAIEPALIASPADNEAVTTTNVPFTVALASDNLDTSITPGVFYTLDIDLVEVF